LFEEKTISFKQEMSRCPRSIATGLTWESRPAETARQLKTQEQFRNTPLDASDSPQNEEVQAKIKGIRNSIDAG